MNRLERSDAIELFQRAPFGELARMGFEVRQEKHPGDLVTFVHDTNPNYTNVCEAGCSFCAFHCADAAEEGAFTLSPSELAHKVARAAAGGATTVLLQGGHNPGIGLKEWRAYIHAIRAAAPQIHIHPFSPPEVLYTAEREEMTVAEVIAALRAEGIETMPGGGAEMLVDRVRGALSPRKYTAGQWLEVMEEAHRQGMRTTATMMFGHIETEEEIVDHLLALRAVQDRTGGFSSFIPWSFKPGGSPLSRKVRDAAHPGLYPRVIAIARLVLDNFSHVQSSWFSESERAGELGLLAGADDFGGILVEENVLKQTGYNKKTTADKVMAIIRRAGFTPALRDSNYSVIEPYSREEP